MSTNTLTQVFGPDDARRLRELAEHAEREYVGDGYLIEYDTLNGTQRVQAFAADRRRIATALRLTLVDWLVYADPLPSLTAHCETDAIDWLTYLADLHTAAVTR